MNDDADAPATRSDGGRTGGEFDADAVVQAVAACQASQVALVDDLDARSAVDSATPSRLPDWTVGHVLTHIARNGDSIVSMLSGQPQYPGGREQRDADIETGARRDWTALVADVTASAERVVSALQTFDDWGGEVTTITGTRPAALVPFLRQREVEVHRFDLGLGYEFADMPSEYLRRELRMMEMLWRANKPMGLTPLPPEALAVAPPERLAWMMGRAAIDGLEPADIY